MAELDKSRRLDAVFAQAPVAIMILSGPDLSVEFGKRIAVRNV